MKRFLIILLCFAGLLFIALEYAPLFNWRALVETRLKNALEEQGIKPVSLTLREAWLDHALVENIVIGSDNPLRLKDLDIRFAPKELWNGRLRDIEADGASIHVVQEKGKWLVSGLATKPKPDKKETSLILVTSQQLAALPFDNFSLTNSTASFTAPTWELRTPFALRWHRETASDILLDFTDLQFQGKSFSANAAALALRGELQGDGPEWKGTWQASGIQMDRAAEAGIPVLGGKGVFSVGPEKGVLEGTLQGPDAAYRAALRVDYPFTNPRSSLLIIKSASIPWEKGQLSASNVPVPIFGNGPIRFTLRVQNVAIGQLMQKVTGKRVTATGRISGTIPLVISRKGKVTVGQGVLKADGPGKITIPPELLPGDNESLVLARDVLKNFNYDFLSAAITGDRNKPGLWLALEGRNPSVYNGRPVKLNIRLTGDVLDFIQQNVLLFSDPQKLLSKDRP